MLRGARQTGKTYIINEFGNQEFRNLIYLNFERNPEYMDIFQSKIPVEIVEKITLYTAKKIEPGKTLLFIDEIQECPGAIVSLRYFFEEMQGLHVIAAGSLLEFAIKSEDFRMPVGRIQYLFLYPLSFGEFLDALDESELRDYTLEASNLAKLPLSLHDKLNDLVRKYLVVGGMPAVLKEYITTRNINNIQRIQRSIIDTYIDDFAIKSRDLKESLELLERAGVVSRVRQTNGSGLPLSVGVHESIFKILFLDVGLFHAISGLYSETAKEKDFNAIFKGAVAEQFAGQEIKAYQSPYTKSELYYWGRSAKSSTAELDYLIEKDSHIIPVEIKSGPTGRMKSMHMFIEKHSSENAIRISQAPFKKGQPILSLPFYGIESYFRN